MALLWRWPDLPLRTKGLIVVAFPAAATVIIACASWVLGARAAAAEESVHHCVRISAEIQRLTTSETLASAHIRAYFITTDKAFADEARATFVNFDAARQELAELVAGDVAQTRRLAEVAALQLSREGRVFGDTARFDSHVLPPEELRAAVRSAETERVRMDGLLQTMQEDEKRLLETRLRRVATLRAELRATTGICVFIGVIGGVVISLLFASGITNRIGKLRENVAQLAKDGVLAPLPGGRDEIGALSEGVARTAEILRKRTVALENAWHGIAEADAAGGYVSFNKAYADLAGLSEDNAAATIAATVHSEDRGSVEAAIASMRANGRAETEARIVHPGGRVVDIGMTFLPLAESAAGFCVFARDVSLRKETEVALLQAREAAIASNRERTAFLAKISHDIRTPLNAILGAADLLSETPLNADQARYIGLFQRNNRRLVELINDFLDFSRIEAGAMHMRRVPFRVRDAVDDAAATFRESASRKGIDLAVEIEAGVPVWILGDPSRVQQVLVNLVSNAVKFTDAGRVTVAVRRTRHSGGEAILYEVSDTGAGIAAADQARVFVPFTQLPDQAAGTRGCGLGLAICRELVERMGGEIGVTSRKGSGSTFYFHTPLEAGQAPDTPADGEPGTCGDQWRRGEAPRILIVEDTEDNRLLLEAYLKGEPVETTFAESGIEALDAIRQNREFDLILMDIDLPGLDGHETTALIRAWESERAAPPTPVVALSAHAMRESVRASLDAGCNAHVAKPVDRATLLRTIRRYALPRKIAGPPPPDERKLAEGVAELVPQYLASKPKQIEEARACLAAKDFDSIRRFGHNLRGTGAGYGFPCMAGLGTEIEKAAAQGDETRIARQLDALNRMLLAHAGEGPGRVTG